MDVGILKQYADEGMTRKEIAERIGKPYNTVTAALRKYGINVVRKKRVVTKHTKRGPKPQTIKIVELRKKGLLYKEIADMVGCSECTVKEACVKYGLKQQFPVTTDEAVGYIDKAGYDYIQGFVKTRSKVTVRCRLCGGTFDRMYKYFRDTVLGTNRNKLTCPHCFAINVEEYRKRKKEPKEREAQMKAQQRAEQLSRKVNNQLARRLAIHVCKNCGQEFCMASTGYNSEQYCSDKCQKRWHNRIKNDKRIKRMETGEHDIDITLDKLFRRDGGVCYICGKMCDWTDIVEKDGAMIAGDSYPSIDHVKPLSKGGSHTWDNLRLACRRCNTAKGWKE